LARLRSRLFIDGCPLVVWGYGAVMRRRAFLAGLCGTTVLAAVAPTRAASRLVQGPGTERPFALSVPGLASDGEPVVVSLSTHSVYQGGTLRVRASAGAAGTATVLGREYALLQGPTGLEGYVGFGTEDPVGDTAVDVLVYGPRGPETVSRPVSVLKTNWTVDYITIPPSPPSDDDGDGEPDPLPPLEQPFLDEIYPQVTQPRQWTDPWIAPLAPPLRVTGYFGEQRSFNGGPVQGHHGGTDFGAAMRTPILAVNEGTVVLSGLYRTRGNLVVIDHGGGVHSLCGHMSERAVEEGATVRKGDVIGLVGSTGLSTGAHLHWEMVVAGVLVDGLRWLDGTQGF
jgi:murein DD-endopeptidase MepM/ murein hydrolase activator NlpD